MLGFRHFTERGSGVFFPWLIHWMIAPVFANLNRTQSKIVT